MPFYNGYYNSAYPFVQQPVTSAYDNSQNIQPQNTIDVIEIQGGEPVAFGTFVKPGKAKLMIDRNESAIYIKRVDVNGMPLPLEILDFTVRQPNQKKETEYVTKDGLEELVNEIIDRKLKGDVNELQHE